MKSPFEKLEKEFGLKPIKNSRKELEKAVERIAKNFMKSKEVQKKKQPKDKTF
jgi:hypothetical protein